uniref:Uncharacterized protein n=1 Tax=viral metagenome TaxID=1070528 RepID=A0A2V0RK42_9ZZZZ
MSRTANIDAEFTSLHALFNGAHEHFGAGKTVEIANNWIQSASDDKEARYRIEACCLFYLKGIKYLLKGETKASKDAGKTTSALVDPSLIKYLPVHASMPKSEDSKQQKEMEDLRNSLPSAFKYLNVTMIRNVAFLAFEAQAYLTDSDYFICPKSYGYFMKFRLGPSEIAKDVDKYITGSDKTVEIAQQHYSMWASMESYWKPCISDMKKLALKRA